ncbi:uncharacterized protein LOC119072897 [Bradysia coprophila]|uniref:uncharacterized protein LOC119072897 n=1 Tax=Bradysia coprophila TaxID=38358 RepID=UPI00187D6FCB|nr:uncharacterized protein LOC119072897 [Bradysia coprophila]
MKSLKVILLLAIMQVTVEFSLRPKYFKVERAGSCKAQKNHRGKLERFDLEQPTKYEFHLDADLRILADVTNPIQFHIKYSKCTLENEGNNCDDHETAKFDNICDVLADRNAPWSELLKLIKPRLMCPIRKGLYTIRNGSLDLSMFSRLPIDGYRYVTTLSLYETPKGDSHHLQLACLDSDVIVTVQYTSGRSRHKG